MGMIIRRGEDDFEDLPLGMRDAILANYFDVGIHEYEGKQTQRVVLLFELADRRTDGKRFLLGKEFNASLSSKSSLYAFLCDWRGVGFSPEDLKAFQMDRLLGKPATLQLSRQQNPRSRRIYTEIDAIFRARRRADPLTVETPSEYIPEWVQRRIDTQIIPGYPSAPQGSGHASEDFTDDIPF